MLQIKINNPLNFRILHVKAEYGRQKINVPVRLLDTKT